MLNDGVNDGKSRKEGKRERLVRARAGQSCLVLSVHCLSFFLSLSLSFSLRLSLCLTSPHLAYHFVFSIAIDLLLLAPLSCGRSYYNSTTTPKLQIVKSGGRDRSYMSLFQTLFMSRCVVRLLRRPFR